MDRYYLFRNVSVFLCTALFFCFIPFNVDSFFIKVALYAALVLLFLLSMDFYRTLEK
jgi:hypothetical protein